MSKLAVGLVIGASLASSVGSAVGNVESGLGKLKTQSEHLKLGQSVAKEYQTIEKEIGKVGEEFAKTGYKSVDLGRKLVTLEKSKYRAGQEAKKYGLNVKNLSKDMVALGTAAKQAEGQIGRMEARMARVQQRRELRGQLIGTTTAAVAVLGYPIKAATSFEAQMSRVSAITKATVKDYAALSEAARDQGRKTQFTASQAAQAQEYLGMAGYKTNEIISALPGNLSLAAAGQLDLARTADISSNILSGFSLKAAEADRVADVLAETATSTNTNIEQMGDAMKYAAPIAQTLGVSLEQTAAMVGVMANAGLQGSLGGTALRASLTRMTSNKQAIDYLYELKVKTCDLNGNLLPVPEIMKRIAEKTSKMGTAQRAAAYSTIFGREAVSGMAKVIEAAADGSLDSFISQLNDCDGAADKMAETMNKNLKGAMFRFTSAVESVAIDLGNGLLPTLADGADSLAVFIGKVSEFADKHPYLTKALALSTAGFFGLKAASIVGRMGYSYLADGASIANGAFQMLRPSTIQATLHLMKMKGTGSVVGGVVKMLGGGVSSFAKGAVKDFKAIGAGFKALGVAAAANPIGLIFIAIVIAIGLVWYYWEPIKKAFLTFWPKLKTAWEPIGEGIKKPFVVAFGWIGDKMDWFSQKWDSLKKKLGVGDTSAPTVGSAVTSDTSAPTVGSVATGDTPAPTVGSVVTGDTSTPTVGSAAVAPQIPGHATGGIFNRPHIAAFAKSGEEWEPLKKEFLTWWPKVKATWELIGEGIKKPFVVAFGWIGDKIDWFSQKWDTLKKKLGVGDTSAPTVGSAVTGDIAGSTVGSAAVAPQIPGHATGGIFNRPHIAAFAEGGKEEAAINISDNDARAHSIWRESGRRMGILKESGGSSPPININVYGASGQSPTDIAQEVKRVLAEEVRKAKSRSRGRFADAAVFG